MTSIDLAMFNKTRSRINAKGSYGLQISNIGTPSNITIDIFNETREIFVSDPSYNITLDVTNPAEIGAYNVTVTLFDSAQNVIARNQTEVELNDENIRKEEITDEHRSIALGVLSYMNMIKRKVEK